MARSKQPVCNRDCFHCPHPDCIVEDMTSAEFRESQQRDKPSKLTRPPEQLAARRERMRSYYWEHREECLARSKAYRDSHKEYFREQKRIWFKEHPEVRSEQNRRYRESHRDELNAKARERRKAARLAAETNSASS